MSLFDEFFSETSYMSNEAVRIQSLIGQYSECAPDEEWLASLLKKDSGWELKPVQKYALQTLRDEGCLIGGLGVGSGKTLIAWLSVKVLEAKNAIIFVPASLKHHFYSEVSKYKKNFNGPKSSQYTVMSYSELSKKSGTDLLERLKPDLIVMDEAHRLRNETAARTQRFLRYLASSDCKIVPMSGTLFNKSLKDVSHFFRYGMGQKSPIPVFSEGDLESWSNVLDYDTDPAPRSLSEFKFVMDHYGYKEKKEWKDTQIQARQAFYELLDNTAGFVLSDTMSCSSSIYFDSYKHKLSDPIKEAIKTAENEGTTPDGEHFFETPAHAALCIRQLATGFYYSYDWDAIGGYDEDWVMARKAWNKAIRSELEDPISGYDSPGLIKDKVSSDLEEGSKSWLCQTYKNWLEQSNKPTPPRKVTWVCERFIGAIAEKIHSFRNPHLVWFHFNETGNALKRRGIEVYKSGDVLNLEDLLENPRTIALSIKAFGEGVNLQMYHHNFVIESPTSNSVWEQMLGRTHRQGQLSDEINVAVNQSHYTHSKALRKSIDQARYVSQTTGQPQRLTVFDWRKN